MTATSDTDAILTDEQLERADKLDRLMSLVVIHPGDMLIFRVDGNPGRETLEFYSELIRQRLPGIPAVLVDDSIQVSVLRPEQNVGEEDGDSVSEA